MFKRRKIECSNCSSILDEKNFSFLLLCGHPLCQSCFTTQSQIGAEINCSSCRMKVTVSDSVPKYLLVDPIMTDHDIQNNCVICAESHPATKYCLDCNQTLCESSANFHLRFTTSSKHHIVTIEEYDKYQKAYPHLSCLHPKSCIQHKRSFEFLDLSTQTRNMLLCTECLNGEQHSLAGLSDCVSSSSYFLQKIDHIRELDSERTAYLDKLREEEEKLNYRLKGLEESRDGVLSDIRRVFGSLHEALQTRQLELEREVEELTKSAGFSLSEEHERSLVWQGQLLMLGKCVEEINSISLAPPASSPSSDPSPSSSPSDSHSSFPFPGQSSTSIPDNSPLESPFPNALSPKALMVDVCLLEDALQNSLTSLKTSTCFDYQIRDQLIFSFHLPSLPLAPTPSRPTIPLLSSSNSSSSSSSSFSLSSLSSSSSYAPPSCASFITHPSQKAEEEKTLFLHISSMFYLTSISPSLSLQSDCSKKRKVQSVKTLYWKETGNTRNFYPYGMTYSPDSKHFYVTDFLNHRIQVFRNHPQAEREGRLEIEFLPPLIIHALSSSFPFGSFFPFLAPDPSPDPRPTCICYHDGKLFIVDYINHQVQVWREEDGSFLSMIGTGSAGKAVGQFSNPWGCTIFESSLFVSDYNNNRIQKFSLSDFSVVKVIGSDLGQFSGPKELAVFNGELYVVDWNNHRICVFDPESGAALSVIGPSLLNDENLIYPEGILFSHNLLFVSSQDRISVFDSDHNYLYSFGSKGTGEGQFSQPQGMVMVDDRLFVCDSDNGRVQVFEQNRD